MNSLDELNDFILSIKKNSQEDFKANKKQIQESVKAENDRRSDILKLKHVHKLVDKLNGTYPITKQKLLQKIELIPNGIMITNDNGIIIGNHKWLCLAMISDDLLEPSSMEDMYDFYLTEVKPWINQ